MPSTPTLSPRARALLVALLLAGAGAQGTPTAAPTATTAAPELSLARILADLRAAPGYRSADLALRAAQQSLDAARARNGLTVGANADLTVGQSPIGSATRSGGTVGATASANLLPWSPGYDAVRNAERALERAEADARDSRTALVLTAAQQYLNARGAALDRTLAGEQLDLAERQLAAARAQRANGVLTQENLLDRQRDLESAQASLDAARLTLDLSVRTLYNTLGYDALGTAPDATPAAPVFSTAPTEPSAPAPLADLVTRAQTRRSEVLKAASTLRDAQAALDVARRDRLFPNVSVTARYGQLGSGQGATGTVLTGSLNLKSGAASLGLSAPLGGSDIQNSASLGLSGSFNFLDPAADAAIRSAETSVASAALALESARTSVELDVRQRVADLQNALAGLRNLRTALTRAQTALETARAREAAGLGTALDTLAADLAARRAARDLDTAVTTAYLAGLRLANATADLDPALLGGPR